MALYTAVHGDAEHVTRVLTAMLSTLHGFSQQCSARYTGAKDLSSGLHACTASVLVQHASSLFLESY